MSSAASAPTHPAGLRAALVVVRLLLALFEVLFAESADLPENHPDRRLLARARAEMQRAEARILADLAKSPTPLAAPARPTPPMRAPQALPPQPPRIPSAIQPTARAPPNREFSGLNPLAPASAFARPFSGSPPKVPKSFFGSFCSQKEHPSFKPIPMKP